MYKELTECVRGWRSSWSTELLFNEARIVSSENVARQLSSLAMWHRAANSHVVEDFGRAPFVVQPEDEAETRGALPEKVFNSQKVHFSPEDTMAIPLAQGSLVVLCGRVRRQVADSASRGATRHRADRS